MRGVDGGRRRNTGGESGWESLVRASAAGKGCVLRRVALGWRIWFWDGYRRVRRGGGSVAGETTEGARGTLYSTWRSGDRVFTSIGVQLLGFGLNRAYQILWKYSIWGSKSGVLLSGNKRFLKCLFVDYKGVISM